MKQSEYIKLLEVANDGFQEENKQLQEDIYNLKAELEIPIMIIGGAIKELDFLIKCCNKSIKEKITASDTTEPEYFDFEECHLLSECAESLKRLSGGY
jgi:hypothetical protein